MAKSHRQLGRRLRPIRLHHRLHDLPHEHLIKSRIGNNRLVRRQVLHQFRSLIEIPRLRHANRPRGVRMRCPDHHAIPGNATTLCNLRPRLQHQITRHKKQIQPHQRHPLLPIIKHHRPRLARIVESPMQRLPIAPGCLHPNIRRYILLRKPRPEATSSSCRRSIRSHRDFRKKRSHAGNCGKAGDKERSEFFHRIIFEQQEPHSITKLSIRPREFAPERTVKAVGCGKGDALVMHPTDLIGRALDETSRGCVA